MNRKAARQAIEAVHNFVLATHVRPDGDALGSLFGLARILTQMGKQAVCYLEEMPTEVHSVLAAGLRLETDIDRIHTFAGECGQDIMGICLDCGDMARLGKNGAVLREIKPFLVIDHHQGNSGFGDLHWIEPHRSSTGEMVYDLAVELGAAEELSLEAAECLYTAIVTDTGSFQYNCTSAHTLAVASRLLNRGVKPALISERLYDNASFGSLQLMQLVLSTLQTFFDDQVAVIQVSRKMLETTGTDYEDCDGLINFPRSIKGVRAAVFLKERKDDEVSVSIRAKGDCDVAWAAAQFGGGGHKNAAGFRLHGSSMEQVRDMLLPVLEQALRQGSL
ncbi:DHH family phosphoesterase [Candidatus Electronema sp. PJ]|uniref:DHH family phosphoesterase n=1 Tax=Candidatus Electronema sp. PJ TaxID=3401572 RepID=UPI003AA9ADF8